MRGGTLNLSLDVALAAKIRQAAKNSGVSHEAYATILLEQAMFDYDEYDWADEAARLKTVGEVDERMLISVEELTNSFLSELDKRVAARS